MIACVGVVLRCSADGIVAGRVTRADNGAPVKGAAIMMKESGPALTDADGHYELHHRLEGNHGIWINADGLAFQRHRVDVSAQGRVDGIDWVLPPSFQVRGRVADEQGTPVANARISVPGWEENQTVTGVDGSFLYDTMQADAPLVINAESPECDQFIQIEHPASNAGTLVLCRRNVATISGLIVDPDGQPARDIRVHVCLGKSVADDDDDSGREFITAADGRFRIPVAGGTYDLFMYNWQKTQVSVLRQVTLSDGERLSDLVIWLYARPEISGHIESGNSALFAERALTVRPLDLDGSTCFPFWFYESSRTDAAGRFRVRQLLPGRYRVEVFTSRTEPPFFSQIITVTEHTTAIVVRASAGKIGFDAPARLR